MMPKYIGVERRQFVRIPFWFVTKYRVYPYEGGSATEFRKGMGKNISVGGICFEAEDSFPPKTTLEVELDMPALDHSVRIVGQIVWSRLLTDVQHYVYGVVFTKIKPEDVEAVRKIVETFA